MRALRLVQRNAMVYRRVWRGSLFMSFLQPTLFLLAMGLGMIAGASPFTPVSEPLVVKAMTLVISLPPAEEATARRWPPAECTNFSGRRLLGVSPSDQLARLSDGLEGVLSRQTHQRADVVTLEGSGVAGEA